MIKHVFPSWLFAWPGNGLGIWKTKYENYRFRVQKTDDSSRAARTVNVLVPNTTSNVQSIQAILQAMSTSHWHCWWSVKIIKIYTRWGRRPRDETSIRTTVVTTLTCTVAVTVLTAFFYYGRKRSIRLL